MQNGDKHTPLSTGKYQILASQEEIHYLSRTLVLSLHLASCSHQTYEYRGLIRRADFVNHGANTTAPQQPRSPLQVYIVVMF